LIEKSKVKIDKRFFQNPQALPLLELVKKCFVQWLIMFGLSDAKANDIDRGRCRIVIGIRRDPLDGKPAL